MNIPRSLQKWIALCIATFMLVIGIYAPLTPATALIPPTQKSTVSESAPCTSNLAQTSERVGSASIEFLGEKTVSDVIPGAQAGDHLPPDQVLQIWHDTTRNIYVGIDPDSDWGDRELTALWYALDTFETEFSDLFDAVFLESNDGATTFLPRPEPSNWVNTNQVSTFIVLAQGFQSEAKQAIATNYYFLGSHNNNTYANIPFIGINPVVIDGEIENLGPQPIYPDCSREGAKTAYLNEGLGDTLLHERLHGFISQFYNNDQLFSELRPGGNQPLCEYNLEELLIKQYLLEQYRTRPHLFSEPFWQYWTADTQILAANVQSTPCYARIAQLGLLDENLLKLPYSNPN